jgi:hypothetical protein
MARMPEHITVGRMTYRVTATTEEWHELSQSVINSRDHGATNHHRLLIAVNPTDHPQQQADTLLHETLHCCWFIGCVDTAVAVDDVHDREEKVIGQLTPWLVMALAQNPDLVAFLQNPEA